MKLTRVKSLLTGLKNKKAERKQLNLAKSARYTYATSAETRARGQSMGFFIHRYRFLPAHV